MDYIIKGDSDCPIAEIHLQTLVQPGLLSQCLCEVIPE